VDTPEVYLDIRHEVCYYNRSDPSPQNRRVQKTDPTMNKRSLLKGILGGTVAGPDAMRQAFQARAVNALPSYPTPDGIYKIKPEQTPFMDMLEDPFRLAKDAFVQQAREAAQKESDYLARKQHSLARLKSTSEAWRESQLEKLVSEQANVWERFNKLRAGIFGWGEPNCGQAADTRAATSRY
jgi:hypothetical protein